MDFLIRQEKQKAEERSRRADEERRRAELDKERLRVEAERLRLMRESEARRRAETERLQLLRNQEAQRRAELEENLRRAEAERLRLARQEKASPRAAPAPPPAPRAAPPQVAARPPAPIAAPPRAALTLPPPPTKRVKLGVVKLIKGWATAKQKSGSSGGLFKAYDIFTTDRLQTNSTSVMHVAFDDGTMLRMGNGTELVVESLGSDPRTGLPGVALELRKGALRLTAGGTVPVTATVRSRSAVMQLQSTDFAVEVSPDKTTRLVLLTGSGVIASTLGGPTVDVKPGAFVSLERDSSDLISEPVTYDESEPERLIAFFKPGFGLTKTGRDPNEAEDGGGDDGAEDDDHDDDDGYGD